MGLIIFMEDIDTKIEDLAEKYKAEFHSKSKKLMNLLGEQCRATDPNFDCVTNYVTAISGLAKMREFSEDSKKYMKKAEIWTKKEEYGLARMFSSLVVINEKMPEKAKEINEVYEVILRLKPSDECRTTFESMLLDKSDAYYTQALSIIKSELLEDKLLGNLKKIQEEDKRTESGIKPEAMKVIFEKIQKL